MCTKPLFNLHWWFFDKVLLQMGCFHGMTQGTCRLDILTRCTTDSRRSQLWLLSLLVRALGMSMLVLTNPSAFKDITAFIYISLFKVQLGRGAATGGASLSAATEAEEVSQLDNHSVKAISESGYRVWYKCNLGPDLY